MTSLTIDALITELYTRAAIIDKVHKHPETAKIMMRAADLIQYLVAKQLDEKKHVIEATSVLPTNGD